MTRLRVWRRWLGLPLVLVCGLAVGQARAQQIAITFDDLPVHGPLPPGETRLKVARQILRALKAAHVPPTYGFVNGIRIQEQPDTVTVLAAWRAAGNPLGNHTFSHMNLNQHSLTDFEQDVLKNEPVLRLQMNGEDWHWFRFPFLAEGDTINKQMGVRVFLAQHGYRIAGVTMSFGDYNWNEPYARCSEKHDAASIAWLGRSYLEAADDNIDFDRQLSDKLYGKQIPYVLLMHIGAFDAQMLPRLLRLYRARGLEFISLEQAEKDPFYRYDLDPRLLPGPDTLEAAAAQKHIPLPERRSFDQKLSAICR